MKRALLALAVTALGCGPGAQYGGHYGLFGGTPDAIIGPAPTDVQDRATAWLKARLKDPDSLKQLEIGDPVLASCAVGVYSPFRGWRVPVSYNAKNSYGGYVGVQTQYLWFHGDRLVAVTADGNTCTNDVQSSLSQNVGY